MVINIDKVVDVEVFNFDEILGFYIIFYRMMELKNYVNDLLVRKDIIGVVIIYGIDSLEEIVYFLDFIIDNIKFVIVIGVMRSSFEFGYDGLSNLFVLVCIVVFKDVMGKGVFVVLNNEVLLVFEVIKINIFFLNIFKFLISGLLGIIDCNEFVFIRDIVNRIIIDIDKVEFKVVLFKVYVGENVDFIRFVVDSGYKGIVIEVMGRGNIFF